MRDYLLKILTPEKRIYENKVISVTVTGAGGRLTVLAGHAPMLALLAEGPIIVRTEQETIEGIAGCGLLRVDRHETAVMIHEFRWIRDEAKTPGTEDTSVEDRLSLL